MPDTLIANLAHFLDEHGDVIGGPPGRIARHIAMIAEAATAHPPGEPFHSAIRCRRRPERVRCPGYILANRTDVPAEIRWECHRCGDRGVITGWEDTRCDLRNARERENDDAMLAVAISDEHFAELRAENEDLVIDCPAVIAGAEYHDGVIVLRGNASEMDEFVDVIADVAGHTENRKRQRLLDEIAEAVEARLEDVEDDDD